MNSKQISFASLSDELAKVNTNKRIFLAKMERLIPWAKWISIIKPHYLGDCKTHCGRRVEEVTWKQPKKRGISS